MIFINEQLDKLKDENGIVQVNKKQNAYPHLYDEKGKELCNFYVGYDEANENLLVETTINDTETIKQKLGEFIKEQKLFLKNRKQKLQKELAVCDKRIKAINTVLADKGLSREFTKADCCRSMYEKLPEGETSNRGKVGIISMECLAADYRKPEYQLFRLEGGFGCSPTNGGNACFGKFCADGSEARMERFDFLGIANAEVEKIAEELEAGWSGGASGCAEKEREPDEPEM